MTTLTVLLLPSQNTQENKRMKAVLSQALQQVPHRIVTDFSQCVLPCKILFALSVGVDGINPAYLKLLGMLRRQEVNFKGTVAGMVLEAESDLYGKALAGQFAFGLNQAGCALVGSPLVEATATLHNFHNEQQMEKPADPLEFGENLPKNPMVDYIQAVGLLASRILGPGFRGKSPLTGRPIRPKVLGVQHREKEGCNALDLWGELRRRLEPFLDCESLVLQTESLTRRNAYKVEEADAVLLVCPSYHNSLHALQVAFTHQLSAQFRQHDFSEKALYALVVSPYSGGDVLATQLISTLCLDQGFYLPPRFAMLETASQPMEAIALPEIELRLDRFAHGMLETLSLGLLI